MFIMYEYHLTILTFFSILLNLQEDEYWSGEESEGQSEESPIGVTDRRTQTKDSKRYIYITIYIRTIQKF